MRLSVLDPVPVPEAASASAAIASSLRIAALADRSGFTRYWTMEHHGIPSLAGTAPEVMLALAGTKTRRIRLGAGAVLLGHYAPLHVAEIYRFLAGALGDRIDVAIGRAPVGDRLVTRALGFASPDRIEEAVVELRDWLADVVPVTGSGAGARAMPIGVATPELWLCGSSGRTAELAAKMRLPYAHAGFLQPSGTVEALTRYRAASTGDTRPAAILAVTAYCAHDEAEAAAFHASVDVQTLRRVAGFDMPQPSFKAGLSYVFSEHERAILSQPRRERHVGTAAHLRDAFATLCRDHDVEELAILTMAPSTEAREASYERLATILSAP